MKKILFFILITLAIFTRFYNLDHTARFTRDESSDLISIKNIYQNKKITLIGPRDENNVSIFSSLTYYLLLPFAIIYNFDPMSPVYGTASYGIFTIIIFALALKKTKWSYLILVLSIIFAPFLESSRWAWNPHLIPFWQSLALLILLSGLPHRFYLVGLLMGFTIHQHWYALFTVLSFIPLIYILNKKFKYIFQYLLGTFLTISPFILFDLTHPPGLFITRLLYFSPLSSNTTEINFLLNLWQNTIKVFQYFSGNQQIFGLISLILTILILVIHRHSKNNIWLLPLAFQIIGLSLTHSSFANRYLLPTAIFYLFWLSKYQKNIFAKLLTFTLIISNIVNLPTALNFTDWSSNIQAQKQITQHIIENQKNNLLFNLIVLESPDGNTLGLRFKDLLTLKNMSPIDKTDYKNIDTLYVISYQNDWNKLSQDPAYELDSFRKLTPKEILKINDSDWFVYKISKSTN